MLPTINDPMIPNWYQITKRKKETHDTFTLYLEPQDKKNHAPQLRFSPGQFNMIYTFGQGEVPISISGNPSQNKAWVHTIRAVGSITRALQKNKVGDTVGIRGPFGKPWPLEQAKGRDVTIIAGGLGLAPLRPVLYFLKNNRNQFGKIILLYGARNPKELLFQSDLKSWQDIPDFKSYLSVDQADSSWQENVGFITTLIHRLNIRTKNNFAFICGPEIMMRFAITELKNTGFNDMQIFISMERNMKCAIGFCGHCQLGSEFMCKNGPVFSLKKIKPWLSIKEL